MSEFRIPATPAAFVFPGQGSQCAEMLAPFRGAPGFAAHFECVCGLLGYDPLAEAAHDPQRLNANVDSSLLTVLASVLSLELARQAEAFVQPIAIAGYSVGQWTALYGAGAIDALDLFSVVHARARLMDDCIAEAAPSGMLAVVGVHAADLERVCEEAVRAGEFLQISNDNAPNQCTLGGSEAGLRFAEARLAPLRPKRMQRVPVAGAWHSTLLAPAVPRLRELLGRLPLRPSRLPVVDNTTGDWLPREGDARLDALARHVASPVLWRQGIQTIAKSGAAAIVEIGYGDLLTKYGFFIDRSIQHAAAAPPPRTRA